MGCIMSSVANVLHVCALSEVLKMRLCSAYTTREVAGAGVTFNQ